MRIKWLVVLVLVIFSAGIVLSVFIIHDNNQSKVDLVAMNEVVKTVEKNWGKVNQEMFNSHEIESPLAIIDHEGDVIYQTSGIHFIDQYDSIKNGDTMLDVKQDNEIVGKIIIPNKEQATLQQMKNKLTISISLLFILFMVLSLLYIFYLHKTLLKPFQQLQVFATNVARGNLDIPIEMTQNNYFGAFTESFDLMRDELNVARQREYESNRSKKELVATLSHDIKTPVASIKAVSELMLMKTKDPKVIKHVNTIYTKAEQINLLVTDMFHATLEELQQLKLTITEESSEILIGLIENVNYDNQITCNPIPPCIIMMDPIRMQQVIDNIISNSYKYAETSIQIHSQVNHGYLELHIQDFGPGIPHEELPLLFNKYFRGENAGSHSGSGLGLYISKYFMENMNGEISSYNRNNGFSVILKIKLA